MSRTTKTTLHPAALPELPPSVSTELDADRGVKAAAVAYRSVLTTVRGHLAELGTLRDRLAKLRAGEQSALASVFGGAGGRDRARGHMRAIEDAERDVEAAERALSVVLQPRVDAAAADVLAARAQAAHGLIASWRGVVDDIRRERDQLVERLQVLDAYVASKTARIETLVRITMARPETPDLHGSVEQIRERLLDPRPGTVPILSALLALDRVEAALAPTPQATVNLRLSADGTLTLTQCTPTKAQAAVAKVLRDLHPRAREIREAELVGRP